MTYKTDNFKIIKGVLSKDTCRILAREFRMTRDVLHFTADRSKKYPFADEMVDNSFSWYSPLCFESLADTVIKDVVSSVLEEPVVPTYSYGRIYYNGSELKKHVDRACSEIAVSVCLDIDNSVADWPLFVHVSENHIEKVLQSPGDIIIYDGNKLPHWRTVYHGHEHINAFMFYVKENGPRSSLIYDTRQCLGLGSTARKLNSEEQWNTFGNLY